MKMRTSKNSNRSGTTIVEFALVGPIFILSIFLCLDFARFWMMEAFVENAVFQAARHVSVFGGTEAEAQAFAEQELSIIGIDEFEINVTATDLLGFEQTMIDDETAELTVVISVEPAELTMISALLRNESLVRSAVTRTNRPF